MSATKIILTLTLALGVYAPGLAQTAAAVESPPGNSAVANASSNTMPQGDNNLPSSGSSLPLLSVIGFGVLVGGIASALKTR